MGSWGYWPRDGDSPCDMEGDVAHEAIAPYLIKAFKKPLPKGYREIVSKAALKAKLSKASVVHPARRLPCVKRKTAAEKKAGSLKRVTRSSILSWVKARKKAKAEIKKEGKPGTVLRLTNASWNMWDRLGLVQILSEKGHGIPVSVVKKCRSYLKKLAKDEGFAETWREPGNFRKSVVGMLAYLEETLEDDRLGQKRAKKRRWRRHRRGPRLIHYPLFRDVPGKRRRVLYKRRKRKKAKKSA